MTTAELLKSLSGEQAKAFNAAFVEMRDNVNAARDTNEQQLTAAHAQEIGAVKDSLTAASTKLTDAVAAKDTAEKAFSDYKTQALAVASAISAAVNDPKTDTGTAVTAILHEATKDERTKQREALEAQKAELEKQLASLA